MISYDEKDVKVRVKGWKAPKEIAENLLREYQTTNSAELSVYRDNKTGNERTVVTKDLESRVKGALGCVGLTSVGERFAEGANAIEAGVRDVISGDYSGLMNVGAGFIGAITQAGSNVIGRSVHGNEAPADGTPGDGSGNISSTNSDQEPPLD